jgi:hypothetical protein
MTASAVKPQIPSTKSQRTSNTKEESTKRRWPFGAFFLCCFAACLGFGAWDLGFPAQRA